MTDTPTSDCVSTSEGPGSGSWVSVPPRHLGDDAWGSEHRSSHPPTTSTRGVVVRCSDRGWYGYGSPLLLPSGGTGIVACRLGSSEVDTSRDLRGVTRWQTRQLSRSEEDTASGRHGLSRVGVAQKKWDLLHVHLKRSRSPPVPKDMVGLGADRGESALPGRAGMAEFGPVQDLHLHSRWKLGRGGATSPAETPPVAESEGTHRVPLPELDP